MGIQSNQADPTLALILAQLGIDNPTVADQTTIMNFLKVINDQIGADGAASATTSLMGYFKLLQDQIGIDNPTVADQTTVMNFLKQIKDGVPAPITPAKMKLYSAIATALTPTTAHSYTGAGVLHSIAQGLYVTDANVNNYVGYLTVTLDGVVVCSGLVASVGSFIERTISSTNNGIAASSTSLPLLAKDLPFTTSLLIQHYVSNTSVRALTTINYSTP